MEPGYFKAKLIAFIEQTSLENSLTSEERKAFIECTSELMAAKYEEFRLDGMSIDESINTAIAEVLESLN
ncbi:hypothetical protein [Siphonobacter sp. SORGH_AS_1065]|uniref:hypothetical protein n=1 Tax=Siphonobacter sp. SORGH_AS_1065 TaxID=3041795 RepID=UPI00277E79E9|nr:hypothetical protein [Siphonobacter sp. SORGH_AS_1065]MDQ1090513.1 hypothetical protein [Siphonobacter sp. SORGH_AS_1065]